MPRLAKLTCGTAVCIPVRQASSIPISFASVSLSEAVSAVEKVEDTSLLGMGSRGRRQGYKVHGKGRYMESQEALA